MADQPKFQDMAKNMLRGELKRRGMGYRDLAEALEGQGVRETEKNLANKISRGSFTAAFFLQCLAAIGVRKVELDE